MIEGIGIDLSSISRIEAVLIRWGRRFTQRCFLPGEREYCEARPRPAVHYASRFAAKEACAKALGVGIARGVGWKDIEVTREPGGPPRLVLHGRAEQLCRERGIDNPQLSLTHDGDFAAAFVVLERTR